MRALFGVYRPENELGNIINHKLSDEQKISHKFAPDGLSTPYSVNRANNSKIKIEI